MVDDNYLGRPEFCVAGMTASIEVAVNEGARHGVEELIDLADVEMYLVKVALRPPERVATRA